MMKKNLFLVAITLLLLNTACDKNCCFPEEELQFDLNCPICDSNNKSYEAPFQYDSDLQQYTLESIVNDPNCGHITSGYVKYLRNGQTAALVQYGHGEYNKWAIKKLYTYSHSSSKGAKHITSCKFEQTCSNNTVVINN